jgi:hypothetical protein
MGMTRQGFLAGIGIVAAGFLVVGLQRHAEREQRHAVMSLAPVERVALVERTLRNLETLCPDAALARQCEAEAQLLLLVPECDATCRQTAAHHLPKPTR